MSARTDKLKDILTDASRRGRLVITGHDAPDVDSLAACALLGDLCVWWGIPAQIVLPTRADKQSLRVLPKFALEPDGWLGEINERDFLALVDHHVTPHAGTVVACIDHHPTANPPPYPYLQIEPSGACAAIVLRLMREAGMPLTKAQRSLAVTALYLDTIALRSSKIPEQEAEWAREEAALLNLDEDFLRREGLHLTDMSLPARELIGRGRKEYEFGGRRVVSSYVQTDAMTADRLDAILCEIRLAVREEGAQLWVFLSHDPEAGRSTEYDVSADGRVTRIEYDRLISRGSDVMPRVEREFLSGLGD